MGNFSKSIKYPPSAYMLFNSLRKNGVKKNLPGPFKTTYLLF